MYLKSLIRTCFSFIIENSKCDHYKLVKVSYYNIKLKFIFITVVSLEGAFVILHFTSLFDVFMNNEHTANLNSF